jgi:cytidine deaminase
LSERAAISIKKSGRALSIDDATWSEHEIAAREAYKQAYDPYSRFGVGARTKGQNRLKKVWACRRVIFEFGGATRVSSIRLGEERMRRSIQELLPEAFGPSNLDAKSS